MVTPDPPLPGAQVFPRSQRLISHYFQQRQQTVPVAGQSGSRVRLDRPDSPRPDTSHRVMALHEQKPTEFENPVPSQETAQLDTSRLQSMPQYATRASLAMAIGSAQRYNNENLYDIDQLFTCSLNHIVM